MMQHGFAVASRNGRPNGAALRRWSCGDNALPPLDKIKAIHVYDFDNTLFASPLPNKQVWSPPAISQLAQPDIFLNGGWWHDASILAATGQGLEKEEPRAWDGWWNEQIVTLVELSMEQKDALTVLLTGRSESNFAGLIKRIVKSRKLDFHMVCLKPEVGPGNQRFTSTMHFKQVLLKDILYTYRDAEEIRIYEDRPKHTKGFRDFLFQFNRDLMTVPEAAPRKPLTTEVIQVPENATQLDPVTEVAEVQRMINAHNSKIINGTAPPGTIPYHLKKNVLLTAYMIPRDAGEKLATLVDIPKVAPKDGMRFLANSILITPRPCPRSILDKVGGLGKKVRWKVTGVSCFENKLWAARVEPIPKTQRIYSENPVPTVVLAIRGQGRPADAFRIVNWMPVPEDQAYEFDSTVGEKALLKIEQERHYGSEWHRFSPPRLPRHPKRAREESDAAGKEVIPLDTNDSSQTKAPQHSNSHHRARTDNEDRRPEDRRPNAMSHNYRGGNQNRGRGHHPRSAYSARGRGNHGGGGYHGRGGGGGRGRGNRNGHPQYRSLDDVGDNSYGRPNYDDPNPPY